MSRMRARLSFSRSSARVAVAQQHEQAIQQVLQGRGWCSSGAICGRSSCADTRNATSACARSAFAVWRVTLITLRGAASRKRARAGTARAAGRARRTPRGRRRPPPLDDAARQVRVGVGDGRCRAARASWRMRARDVVLAEPDEQDPGGLARSPRQRVNLRRRIDQARLFLGPGFALPQVPGEGRLRMLPARRDGRRASGRHSRARPLRQSST